MTATPPQRRAEPAIADFAGPGALPRRSGEMVFHDDWERRAFALAVALHEQGVFSWKDFQQALIASIDDAERQRPSADPGAPGYYELWLHSLERVLEGRGVLTR